MPPQSLKRQPSPVEAPDRDPTLTIQLYNYSTASPATVEGAEGEASRILREAGLRAVWLDCPIGASTAVPPGPCRKTPEAADIRLRVLAAPIQNQFHDSVFGFAVHPVLASVYYDYAWRRAKSDDAESEVTIILGCVIAHELGHLLLGTNAHSATGIMQSRWKPDQFRQLMTGILLFTSAQSNLMREHVQMRSRLQAGNPDPGLIPRSVK